MVKGLNFFVFLFTKKGEFDLVLVADELDVNTSGALSSATFVDLLVSFILFSDKYSNIGDSATSLQLYLILIQIYASLANILQERNHKSDMFPLKNSLNLSQNKV